MTHPIQQWLTEIQSLQARLSQVTQERTDAYDQVSRWHRSYKTEAEQRRTDVQRLQHTIDKLTKENQSLKQRITRRNRSSPQPVVAPPPPPHPSLPRSPQLTSAPASVSKPGVELAQPEHSNSQDSAAESLLRQKLERAIAKCRHLARALHQEKQAHKQTRETLMTALSDTVEQLERERQQQPDNETRDPQAPQLKTPLPEPQQKQLGPTPLASDSDSA